MSSSNGSSFYKLQSNISSSILVFLVALPLCLGISLASGAPLFAGILAGIIGGILVGVLSQSPLSVAGPAAGMSTIVASGIDNLNGFQYFLAALVLAGLLQIALGVLRFGHMGHFIPISVVKGIMASIGLILISKQIPHALGFDETLEGEVSYVTRGGGNTLTDILHALEHPNYTAIFIFVIGLAVLMLFQQPRFKRSILGRFIPAALLVVILSGLINVLLQHIKPEWSLGAEHLVDLPSLLDEAGTSGAFIFPDFLSTLSNPMLYQTALIIAVVGSIETLVSMEAIEKLDPHKRAVSLNRELKAQGLANTILGCIGGIPLTSVIVRSSANISFGAKSKHSTILHGCWLLLAVLFFTELINSIPLASLASILILVAYRLTHPSIYKGMLAKGKDQFLPFVITIMATFFTDLLWGIIIGLCAGIIFTIKANFHNSIIKTQDDKSYLIKLVKDVSFLNKGHLKKLLNHIPADAYVIIDGTRPSFIDPDVIETIEDYRQTAKLSNIKVEIKTSPTSANTYFKEKKR